jgi:hypothetical protein
MEGSCEYKYIELAAAENRQGVVFKVRGLDLGLTTPHRKK